VESKDDVTTKTIIHATLFLVSSTEGATLHCPGLPDGIFSNQKSKFEFI
jgi:hypothetical protein